MQKIIALSILFILLLSACSSEPEQVIVVETREVPVTVEVIQEVEVTRQITTEVEVTRITEMEVTRVVEEIVEIEVTQTPTAQPAQFMTLEGSGNVVSDNYDLQECQKAVFSWEALGRDNMIVKLWKVGADDHRSLVNEIGPDSGEVLQGLAGGTYWITVDGPSEGWSIIGECRD